MPAYFDNERKTWYCSFYYKNWQGERKLKKKRGFKRQKDALAFEREFLLKASGSPDMTFGTLVELYYEDFAHRVRRSTQTTKKNMIETHILPYFKNRIASEIINTDIRLWQNLMLKKKNPRTGQPYKPTYLRSVNSQMSAIFNFGVTFYNLPQNPCSKVKSIGKKRADEMKFWTLDQFNAAIDQEDRPAYHAAFMTLYWTGIREGELLALSPKKILDAIKSLNITATYKREDGDDVFDDPKSENGVRVVSMPRFLYDELKWYTGALYGLGRDDRIFYYSKSALNKELDRIAEKAGLERIRVHDLRHSHVALLIQLGYSIFAIAKRIGDTPEEVQRTYGHLYPDIAQAIGRELDRHQNGFVLDNIGDNNREIAATLDAEQKSHKLRLV